MKKQINIFILFLLGVLSCEAVFAGNADIIIILDQERQARHRRTQILLPDRAPPPPEQSVVTSNYYMDGGAVLICVPIKNKKVVALNDKCGVGSPDMTPMDDYEAYTTGVEQQAYLDAVYGQGKTIRTSSSFNGTNLIINFMLTPKD